jgi:hypothetical protein
MSSAERMAARFHDSPTMARTGETAEERLARAVLLMGTPGQTYIEKRGIPAIQKDNSAPCMAAISRIRATRIRCSPLDRAVVSSASAKDGVRNRSFSWKVCLMHCPSRCADAAPWRPSGVGRHGCHGLAVENSSGWPLTEIARARRRQFAMKRSWRTRKQNGCRRRDTQRIGTQRWLSTGALSWNPGWNGICPARPQ